MKIFLLGLPGSGKTTLGKALAAEMDLPFVDLDNDIEQEAGMTIHEIFKVHREPYFRSLESQVLERRCAEKGSFVMATGGGTPCFHDNMKRILTGGISVFIDIPATIIAQRILRTDLAQRPLFADMRPENLKDAIEWMRSQRLPFYRQAGLIIGADMEVGPLALLLKRETQL